jgi:hypothetical protein
MKRILWVVFAAALVMAGCGDPVPPTTPTPAVPTITETFSDTLLVLGSNTHNFSVDGIGGLKVRLTSLEPSAVVLVGVGYPSLGSCSVVDHALATASQDVLLSGTAVIRGLFCVSITDVGNLVEPVAYTINVLHS